MSAPLLLLKPAFSPAKLAGLSLWLSADRIAGLADGDPVSTWSDLSGQGNNATQSTTAAKPLYKTGIVAGRPAVLFDGVDDWLALTAAVASVLTSDAKTVFAVVRWAALVNSARLVNVSNVAVNSTRFSIAQNATPLYQTFYTTGAAQGNFTWTGAAPSTSNPQVLEVVQSGTSIAGLLNGTQANSGNDAGGEAPGAGPCLGSGTGGNNNFSNVYIMEFIVSSIAWSAGDRSKVRRYLGGRWGVTVS